MNIPLYIGVLVLAALLFIAYKLNLPEGWPRALAFLLVTIIGVAMVVVSARSQNKGK